MEFLFGEDGLYEKNVFNMLTRDLAYSIGLIRQPIIVKLTIGVKSQLKSRPNALIIEGHYVSYESKELRVSFHV